jgi:hypothetical protein
MVSRDSGNPIKPVATVRGAALWRSLGFKNDRAFQRACKAGLVGVRMYPIPGQSRGWFARADELAAYLAKKEQVAAGFEAPEGSIAIGAGLTASCKMEAPMK